MTSHSHLRYLWAYSAGREDIVTREENLLDRRREQGFDVEGFCVTPPSLDRRWLHFYELDYLWRSADRALMEMYEQLAEKIRGRDVLILYNGANLHPDFVRQFNVLKVYSSGDDPESTDVLSKPLAPSFDVHMVNNIACVDMYRGWGLKHVFFWPLGSFVTEDDVADLNEEVIADISKRPLPIIFFGGYDYWRRGRMNRLAKAFPEAFCAGRGWSRGYVSREERLSAYRQGQIGWNVHLSMGPVNFRAYDLPAYGVMQICDNKSYLGQIYELGKEAVGFDSTCECIELTRYYLAHPDEQRDIAVAGWRRWKQDYTPERVWEKLVSIVEAHREAFQPSSTDNIPEIRSNLRERVEKAVSPPSCILRLRYRSKRLWHRIKFLCRALLWHARLRWR